jgi:cysteinyl-tRNA synthetase
MDDDLNTPQALAALFDFVREINRARVAGANVAGAKGTLRELASVLGFTLAEAPSAAADVSPFVDLLVSLRAELRAAKLWPLADRVRDGLMELGVELQDGPAGTSWDLRG